MKMRKLFFLISIVLLLCGSSAMADQIKVSWIGVGDGSVNITLNNGGSWEAVAAGKIKITVNNSQVIYGYCVDLAHTIDWNVNYDATFKPTPTTLAKAAWLINTYGAGVGNDSTQAAALQLAIWNTLIESDASITGGTFRATGISTAVGTTANNMLAALYQGNWQSASATLIDTDNVRTGYTQDFITTPEPTSLVLLGSGLLLFGLYRKRSAV